MSEKRASRHLDETVPRLVELQAAHDRRAGLMQRAANRVTAALGRPNTVAFIVLVIASWLVGNIAAARLGVKALDEFPFPELAFVATIAALIVALLILSAQRHDQALADKRAQLTLQIAILSERKIAKLIELVEEQRQDNPMLSNRINREAEELAIPSDPLASLEQIEAENAGPKP